MLLPYSLSPHHTSFFLSSTLGPPRSTLSPYTNALPISAAVCRGSVRGSLLRRGSPPARVPRSEEHTSELQSRGHLVCRLLLEKDKLEYHSPSLAAAPRASP